MAEPVRETALGKVIEEFQAMTGGAWSYRNPFRVERSYKSHLQVNQFPHVCVIERPDSDLKVVATAGGQQMFEHTLKFWAIGYVERTEGVEARTWGQRLWADWVRVLLKNHTLDGAVSTILLDASEYSIEEADDRPICEVIQGFVALIDETMEVG
jgi:hypothetical protein